MYACMCISSLKINIKICNLCEKDKVHKELCNDPEKYVIRDEIRRDVHIITSYVSAWASKT